MTIRLQNQDSTFDTELRGSLRVEEKEVNKLSDKEKEVKYVIQVSEVIEQDPMHSRRVVEILASYSKKEYATSALRLLQQIGSESGDELSEIIWFRFPTENEIIDLLKDEEESEVK